MYIYQVEAILISTMRVGNPQLPRLLSVPDDVIELFKDDDTISGVHIQSTWLSAADLDRKHLTESLLTYVDFSKMNVPRFGVLDCEFKNCNFTTAKFPESSWQRVKIDGARCSGLQITNGTLRDITFNNCKLELVNLRFSRLENVLFENCVIDDVDFYDAKLKNVHFINCTINEITFASARMMSVDISQSTIQGIKGINSLKGVTISYDQLMQFAPSFAAEFGIKVA
jgi:uncharacterized protein YjbI with pentapeptide repeats